LAQDCAQLLNSEGFGIANDFLVLLRELISIRKHAHGPLCDENDYILGCEGKKHAKTELYIILISLTAQKILMVSITRSCV
jgi:hypothetical protein